MNQPTKQATLLNIWKVDQVQKSPVKDCDMEYNINGWDYLEALRQGKALFSINDFTRDQAIKYLSMLYMLGAKRILITGIDNRNSQLQADTLLLFEPSFEAAQYVNRHHKPDVIKYDPELKAHYLWWD